MSKNKKSFINVLYIVAICYYFVNDNSYIMLINALLWNIFIILIVSCTKFNAPGNMSIITSVGS